jgi:metal-responsive CopG/Arc/MetJ family transcriptional regulator
MRTVLSVSLPVKMAKELNAFAKKMGHNKSDILKESLGLYLWEAKLRNAQKMFFPKAKARGIITEEDMLKEIS